jgi:hypothetical protein
MTQHDITEIKVKGGIKLKLTEYQESGNCDVECRTIQESCRRLFKVCVCVWRYLIA